MSKEQEVYEDGDLNAEFADLEPDAAEALQRDDLDAKVQNDDDDGYSEKVRKRIGKEVYKTKAALTRAEVAEQELHKKNEMIAKMQKEFNEREKLRLTSDVEMLKKQAAAALEEADTEGYMTASDRLLDNKYKLAEIEKELGAEEKAPEPQQPQKQEGSNLAPAAQDWMEANSDWTSTDSAKFERAKAIATRLENEGYDPADPELYQVLDQELNKQPLRQPHGSVPGRSTPVASNNSSRLTTDDLRNMVTYGLNPKDPGDRANWLAGKQGV